MTLRDQILAASDIVSEIVGVTEWGVEVEVRGMTGADRTRILEDAVDQGSGAVSLQAFYPDVVIATCFDPETGVPVFGSDDRVALMAKSAQAIDRIAQVGLRLSGMDESASDAAGKGSSATPNAALSSNSPNGSDAQ
jgi:hypothetical protein